MSETPNPWEAACREWLKSCSCASPVKPWECDECTAAFHAHLLQLSPKPAETPHEETDDGHPSLMEWFNVRRESGETLTLPGELQAKKSAEPGGPHIPIGDGYVQIKPIGEFVHGAPPSGPDLRVTTRLNLKTGELVMIFGSTVTVVTRGGTEGKPLDETR